MTVTVVYDNSEVTELCAAQHLYLKPIAKLMIHVLLPESIDPVRPFSNWEVLDQLKSLICPDQFTTVRLSKSTKDFIRFEGEAETRSLVQILKAKLHGKIIKLNGLKTDLKVVATDAQGEWEHFAKEKEASASDGTEEQDPEKSPDAIYFEGLPCKWFAPKGSSGEKPCEEILRVVFESFGKIKNVDIPMLDPYREVMTGGSFGGLSFGLQTFEAFIQYQESTDFLKAMESLRGMKLMLKGDDGKALACNIKVMFDKTKHFSEGAIKRRNQERLKLQELEEERKKEKKREEEVAERKRKGEARKAQEKKKKSRDKKKALKERDKQRPRREKVLMRKESLEPDQVHIGPLLNHSGSAQLTSQKVDATDTEAHDIPAATPLKTQEEEQLNFQPLVNQEEMPRYPVSNSNSKQKQKMKKKTKARLQNPSHYLQGKKKRNLARKERTGKLSMNAFSCSLVPDQNSLKITKAQGQSLEKDEDHHNFKKSYTSRPFEIDGGRKQKIYETDKFIDYLLNYYQSPEYDRFCLEASHITSTSQWQRDVCEKGNGFQIHLRKRRCQSTSGSEMDNLAEEQFEDDYRSKTCTQESTICEPKKRGKMNYTKGCAKKLKSHCKDTASDSGDQLPPTHGESQLLENTPQVEDAQPTRKSQIYSPLSSVDIGLQLTDFLEEISSDSDCFNDILNINIDEEERPASVCGSSLEKRSLNPDETNACRQKDRSSQQALYSEWKHDNEEKYPKHKLRASHKKSKYDPRCSRLEGESNSTREEALSGSRKEPAPNYLFDEGYYNEFSSSDEVENTSRKKRKVSDNGFGQSMNYRTFQMPLRPVKPASPFCDYFRRERQGPWKSGYNQDERRVKRYENLYMLDSDDYYVRHNDQAHAECGNYLGNNCSDSLYFRML